MGFHIIEDKALIRVVRSAVPAGAMRDGVVAAIERFLLRQPRSPRLVGTTQAARILGVQPPHISRLRDQGRMPDPIEVEGSVDVYFRDEVEELARTLHAKRAASAERRAARAERQAEREEREAERAAELVAQEAQDSVEVES